MTSMEIHPLYAEIGKRIRAEREALGFTQIELAQGVGLVRASIVNIEGGRQKLPIHVLYQIASELAVPVHGLLPDSEVS